MTMQYYCTLFDKYYLTRGLVMWRSLEKFCSEYHLYIFAFDEESRNILKSLDLRNVTIISLNEFEDDRLLAVKSTRSKGEYCWTCTPSTISYCIEKFNLNQCTYIDADLYFYQNPNVLVDEMGDNSILITEHRYTKKYDQSAVSGIYCVQFITFKNTRHGLQALVWWKDRCIEWCYARVEDGKFGDQKYLDDWPERFKGVHVLKHVGGGVAPWNVQQYIFVVENERIVLRHDNSQIPLIFYHFHYVKFYQENRIDLGSYELTDTVKNLIYKPYTKEILDIEKLLLDKFSFPRIEQIYFYRNLILSQIHKVYRILKGVYQIKNINDFVNGTTD